MKSVKVITSLNCFKRENYINELFSSFVLPWNLHDFNEKQTYLYTHRYKATYGFDFSYASLGAQKPELNNKAHSGVGFFSSWGETSWLIYDTSDVRIDFREFTIKSLKKTCTDNGLIYFYYNGIFFNGFTSVQDQINNYRAFHYTPYVFAGMVSNDRQVNSYFERTYWRHMLMPIRNSFKYLAFLPDVLPIRPCSRSDSLIDFFGQRKNGNYFQKLDFFRFYEDNYTNTKLFLTDSVFNSASYFKKWGKFYDYVSLREWWRRIRYQRLSSKRGSRIFIKPPQRFFGLLKRGLFHFRHFRSVGSRSLFLKSDFIKNCEFRWRRYHIRAKNFRLLKKIRKKYKINSFFWELAAEASHYFYNDRSLNYPSLASPNCFKKPLNYRLRFYKRKMRENVRLWFKEGGQKFQNPISARSAIRYRRTFRKRRFIYVF